MKFFTTLLTFGLTAGVLAAPTSKDKRDVADYEDVMYTITDQIAVVDSLINSYVAGQVPGTDVQAANVVLVDLVNDGATQIAGFDPLTVLDVLGLVGVINGLIDDIGAVVDNLIAAEPNFIADGLNDEVLAGLYELQDAGENLRAALLPKVPSSLQNLADQLAAEVIAHLQRAIDAYSD